LDYYYYYYYYYHYYYYYYYYYYQYYDYYYRYYYYTSTATKEGCCWYCHWCRVITNCPTADSPRARIITPRHPRGSPAAPYIKGNNNKRIPGEVEKWVGWLVDGGRMEEKWGGKEKWGGVMSRKSNFPVKIRLFPKLHYLRLSATYCDHPPLPPVTTDTYISYSYYIGEGSMFHLTIL